MSTDFRDEAVAHLARCSCQCQHDGPSVRDNRHVRSCMVGRARAYLGQRVTEQPLYGGKPTAPAKCECPNPMDPERSMTDA